MVGKITIIQLIWKSINQDSILRFLTISRIFHCNKNRDTPCNFKRLRSFLSQINSLLNTNPK